MVKKIQEIELSNRLTLNISDRSRHYFGGFYHVRIVVSCYVAITEERFADRDVFQEAKTVLGDVATFRQDLERMGVHPDDLEAVRRELVESFVRHSLAYMSDMDFPRRFLHSRLKQKVAGRKSFPFGAF